ncbi:hypothetical protein K501DRAFT_304926 [Backusella circina FSU 941]|nr:hypothetical protein K501DRAFT_304926 [Backusella circina FSU 941]
MTSKSLQYSFLNDSYSISNKIFKCHTLTQCEHIPSSAYSTIKKSSPLRKYSYNGEDEAENSQKWLIRRLSSISGSFKSRKKHQKTIAARLGFNRRSRRTYPMSNNSAPGKNIIYYRDSSSRGRIHSSLNTRARKKRNRQSLAEILPSFYEIEKKSSADTSTSSSLSKRIGKIIKKRPKKRYNKCDLRINTREIVNAISSHDPCSGEETSSSVIYSLFKPPPPNPSSKASSPSTPLQFPFPPQRNLSFTDNNSLLHKSNQKRKEKLIPHVIPCIISRISSSKTFHHKDEESQESGKKSSVWLVTEANLFLFGFLFFPLWWLGAWLYWKNDIISKNPDEPAYNEIFSTKAFAYLNIMLSCFSLIMIVSIIAILLCPIEV